MDALEKVLPEIVLDQVYPQEAYHIVVLQCVDPSTNARKYYVMTQHEDTKVKDYGPARYEWTAQWGRIGSRPQQKRYSIQQGSFFEETLSKKVAKGYKPVLAERWGDHQTDLEKFFADMGDDAWELE